LIDQTINTQYTDGNNSQDKKENTVK